LLHIIAWFQSVDPGGAFQAINAVREESGFASGTDIRVPPNLNNIIGEGALINDATVEDRAQIQSPSLRTLANIDIEPIIIAAAPANPLAFNFHPENPVPVVTDEALTAFVASNPAAAVVHYVLVLLADGAPQLVKGRMFSVKFTSTIAQAVGAWTNGNITLSQVLPAGRYQVVGMRVRSADAVAARLLFVGQVPRPGIPTVTTIGNQDSYFGRFGRLGVWGEFPHTTPPTLDVLGGVAAAQNGILDLIKVA
jgi:hypothetical protein